MSDKKELDFAKDYKPLKFGVSKSPLAIIIKYRHKGKSKNYHHRIKLDSFDLKNSKLNLFKIEEYLLDNHFDYIKPDFLPRSKLKKLLKKLEEKRENGKIKRKKKNENFSKKNEPVNIDAGGVKEDSVVAESDFSLGRDSFGDMGAASEKSEEKLIKEIPAKPDTRKQEGVKNDSFGGEFDESIQLDDENFGDDIKGSKQDNGSVDYNADFDAEYNDFSDGFDDFGKSLGKKSAEIAVSKKESQSFKDDFDDDFGDDFDDIEDGFDDIEDGYDQDFSLGKSKLKTKESNNVKEDSFNDGFESIDDGFESIGDGFESIDDLKESSNNDGNNGLNIDYNMDGKDSNEQGGMDEALFQKLLKTDVSKIKDLNKLNQRQVELVKKKMDEEFLKKQVNKGDPGFEYDKSVSFNQEESNDWDESGDWDDDAGSIDIQNTNLNKLNNEQVEKVKKKMDEEFLKKQVKKGDPGFEYDKSVSFNQEESNDWDDDWD